MNKATVVLSVVVVLVALGFAIAQEEKAEDPTKTALGLIDAGRAALVEGRSQAAIDSLQKAIGVIQTAFSKGLVSFLPDAPAGWKADEPDVSSGSWGAGAEAVQWNSATCTYTRESDEVRVEVQISTSPQMLAAQKGALEMYKNPQMRKMLEMDPDHTFEFVEEGDWVALITVEKGESANVIGFHDKVLVTVEVGKPEMELVKRFWNAVDRKALAAELAK